MIRVPRKVLPEGETIKRDEEARAIELEGIEGDCNKTDNKTDAVNINAMKIWLMILQSHIRAFCTYRHGLKSCFCVCDISFRKLEGMDQEWSD